MGLFAGMQLTGQSEPAPTSTPSTECPLLLMDMDGLAICCIKKNLNAKQEIMETQIFHNAKT
jgi:hypothetical protein